LAVRLTDGAAVGSAVGPAVGALDGDGVVGGSVGASVVGNPVGGCVGGAVGGVVGRRVGVAVGDWVVGTPLGELVTGTAVITTVTYGRCAPEVAYVHALRTSRVPVEATANRTPLEHPELPVTVTENDEYSWASTGMSHHPCGAPLQSVRPVCTLPSGSAPATRTSPVVYCLWEEQHPHVEVIVNNLGHARTSLGSPNDSICWDSESGNHQAVRGGMCVCVYVRVCARYGGASDALGCLTSHGGDGVRSHCGPV
jgi:hypothetical protein